MSNIRRAAALLGLALFAILAAAAPMRVAKAEMSPAQKADVENVIKTYLLSHPEVLRDAINELNRREQAQEALAASKAVDQDRQSIFNSPYDAVVGNPHGSVTLVEFFDYNCPHCRNVIDDLGKLLQTHPELRLVLKDFPILTPQSVEAAKVAIALRSQFHGEKFWLFYQKLMKERGLVGEKEAVAAARSLGADMPRLAHDMAGPEIAASLKEVGRVADEIHASGTPTFVLGDSVYAGEMTFKQLTPMIDAVRKCGKTVCA